MAVWLAEAKTSAGAPWLICWANAEDAPKFGVTVTPGCAASNCSSVVNDSCSEAAAKTFTVPVRAVVEAVAACGPGRHGRRGAAAPGGGDRRADDQDGRHGDARPRDRSGSSMTTLVDLTAAMARTPGSSWSSSAASAHQRHDAVRAGLDLDLSHDCVPDDPGDQPDEPVPGRLRADRTRRGMVAGAANDCAKAARSTPATTFRPPGSVVTASRPASIHRRTVSSLTPRSSAASRTRNVVTSGS